MRFRGFTLIELTVVTGIVTLLMTLSVQVLRGARAQAQAAVCAGQVRQLALGLVSYQTENDVFPYGYQMPLAGLLSSDQYAGMAGAVDLPGRWWFDETQTVDHATGQGEKLLTCPSKRQDHPALASDLLCGNYGANLSLCRVEKYTSPYTDGFGVPLVSSREIQRPSETLLVVDSGYALICWWHAADEPPVSLPPAMLVVGGMIQHAAYVPGMAINAAKDLLQGQGVDARGGRHPHKTVNVGFCDGSVARKKADDLLVEKVADGGWNNGPLWQPSGDSITPQETAP